jgi:nucleotide-binding universal stress UspA family protein
MAIRRILAATDGSPSADRAVDEAAEVAKTVDADLLIVTIAGNVPAAELAKLSRAEGNIGDALDLISSNLLREAKERAQRAGAPRIRQWSGWGDPAEAIIEAVRRESIDLIVVGRRGHGQLRGLLLGSVSQKLVSLAPCLVLVVP